MSNGFAEHFEVLTGHAPLSWQTRLYQEHFCEVERNWRSVMDIPTGLGKTMVMAIWLIAREKLKNQIPTRLIYVVDRRTVVDQATDIAEDFAFLLAPEDAKQSQQIAKRKPKLVERKNKFAEILRDLRHGLGLSKTQLAISTLRGQLADNREWSRDPSRPAIIIGTVDLIGSALLFSGYRSSYKRRPLEAGLLGQDSLLVLDEAHLSKPFEKLVCAIGRDGRFQNGSDGQRQGNPVRVIRMSATSATDSKTSAFRLEGDFEGRTGDFADDVVLQRVTAKKRLTIVTVNKIDDATLADEAIKLADDLQLACKRIVVFVRRPEDARKIRNRIRDHGKSKNKPGRFVEAVAVLTGTMRGLERDELVISDPVMKRFLAPDDPKSSAGPCFLVCTSAGEVGFDLNADHLVGDAAPLDSWIQRLGRVNRRGNGDATVILVKEKEPANKTDFDKACTATSELLTDGMDVSPRALVEFRGSLTFDQIDTTSSPKPTMVELTDILLDAWSMTSIIPPMPGRPEVGPWLRGIDDELPQTTIAWRAELDEPGFGDLDLNDIEEWFDAHRILTHETLSVPTASKSEASAEKWLKARWDQLGKSLGDGHQRAIGARPVIVNRSGLRVMRLTDLIAELDRNNASSIRNAEVILPASFGGIEREVGLLDAAAPTKPEDPQGADEQAKAENARERLAAPDIADIAAGRMRLRQVITKSEDGDELPHVIGNGTMPSKPIAFQLDLESDDERRITLVSYVPRREKPEYGSKGAEPLTIHVRNVKTAMNAILDRLDLPEDRKPIVIRAAELAADWHDHGKDRERWQRCAGRKEGETPLGKSGGAMKRDPRGYRHEFGSLREFTDAFDAGKLLDEAGTQIRQDVFDLAMHLIATHHGRGRPHFFKGGFDPDCEARTDEIHNDAIRRFARLQRKYGWWHLAWLENLLRSVDALASAQVHDDENQDKAPEAGE